MDITPIHAFDDNYIWALRKDDNVVVVDPGDAAPVLDYLARTGGTLVAILITHHHSDHIGGISTLLQHASVPVFGPAAERAKITTLTRTLTEGDTVDIAEIDAQFRVIDVGGHTLGHIAYVGLLDGKNTLFCGDTLFAGGCGRIFEGTPEQMHASLSKLAALPSDTCVYCAHEYTQSNLKFALAVEPNNSALQSRIADVAVLRAANKPTLPSTIALELATNPFLRADSPDVITAARTFSKNTSLQTTDEIFAAIRAWKNIF
ncbi:MAG TPA: hydroxyacylglutathione hydrolase [Rhodocyclaceae bacterium]|jgi:hydroxyacylglutathione hydrolase|nr:hydroxyacylglutathione hydrolase [Rhodocyclaceae bacterium]